MCWVVKVSVSLWQVRWRLTVQNFRGDDEIHRFIFTDVSDRIVVIIIIIIFFAYEQAAVIALHSGAYESHRSDSCVVENANHSLCTARNHVSQLQQLTVKHL